MSRIILIAAIGTVLVTLFGISTPAQQPPDLADIERKLDQSMQTIKQMGDTIDSLRAELDSLKEKERTAPAPAKEEQEAASTNSSAIKMNSCNGL